ncbi:hypothetical protein [Shewanella sp.]|uniref:hypothetical protein n=1 Tax=Shewanella TaxID=22 RepID=UPI00257ECAF1|nr:hypothetical protein [Shewanella sp.]
MELNKSINSAPAAPDAAMLRRLLRRYAFLLTSELFMQFPTFDFRQWYQTDLTTIKE